MEIKIRDTAEYQYVKKVMRKKFKRKNPNKKFLLSETARRLRKFLQEHKKYTLTDVDKAVNLYLKNNEPKYVMFMHYFIWKGLKTNSMLLSLLEEIEEQEELSKERKSFNNTIQ